MTRSELFAQGLLMILLSVPLFVIGLAARYHAGRIQARMAREALEQRARRERLKKWRGNA